MYFIGELGFEADGEYATLALAEDAAIEASLGNGDVTISIWDEDDEVVSVAIDGSIFGKRKD